MSRSKAEIKRYEAQKKLFKNKLVVQKNDLIKGDTSAFNINDLKIFKLIISKVKTRDNLFEDNYEISTDEIKALGIKEAHLYDTTISSLKKLANIYIRIDDEEGGREVGLIKNEFKFPKFSRKVLYSFNDDMKDYLLKIESGFTKYPLLDIVNFKYKHTLKLYEYFKSIDLKVARLKIETLKIKLDLVGKYVNFGEFKRRVIEPSLEEINLKSSTLNVTFTLEKKGRAVEYIYFHIQRFEDGGKEEIASLKTANSEFAHYIGLECIYFGKFYALAHVETDENFSVDLKEIGISNIHTVYQPNKEALIEFIKELFGETEKEIIIPQKTEKEIKLANFKQFKLEVVEKFKGKDLLNNAPNFHEDTILALNENGLIINKNNQGKIITSEESLVVWNYLFKNQEKVGVIEEIKNPIKKFKNTIIGLERENALTKQMEEFQYKIVDITNVLDEEDSKLKYKLELHDVYSGEIEFSKHLLSYEQLESLVKDKEVKREFEKAY